MPQDLLQKISQTRVLVIGDAMLDRYWYGGVERISPEAPVPVVAVSRSEERPGGAANVACNVAALGASCTLISASGDDSAADSLERLLQDKGVACRLQRDRLVNTTVKLRVVSRNQQLIRVDFETQVSKDTCAALLDRYLSVLTESDVVIVSDYAKGGLGYVREIVQSARNAGIPVVVDPKGDDYTPYRGASLITPNRKEFEQVAGRFQDNDDLKRRAQDLIQSLDLEGVLVTRSEEGMSLFDRAGKAIHMPARAREVYDVTGAGDTVIAVIGAAYAARGRIDEAMHLANIAAGIGVGRLGAVAVSRAEIEAELAHEEHEGKA